MFVVVLVIFVEIKMGVLLPPLSGVFLGWEMRAAPYGDSKGVASAPLPERGASESPRGR